jgi:hypothetical protein
MKKILAISFAFLLLLPAVAQKKEQKKDRYVALTPENWDFKPGSAEFLDYKGRKAMKINSGAIVLKNIVFKDGTIEYDVEPVRGHLVCFRRKDDQEQESVYLRLQRVGNKLANDGIQYAPYVSSVLMWDMYPQYQGPVSYRASDWNHVKIVVSGKQMRWYMNNETVPALAIPALEGNTTEGSIGFTETSYISNLEIKPNVIDGLSPDAGVDLTRHDPTYIRKWAYASPALLEPNVEPSSSVQPDPGAFTDSIMAERLGLVNLTRKLGANSKRKVVWLKTIIKTDKAVTTNLRMGMSDDAWVFLNNQLIAIEKNIYFQPAMRKYPNGRISIDNARVPLNLIQGENELMVAVTNDFYGWGMIAQVESTNGITELGEAASITKKADELARIDVEPYVGVYNNSTIPIKLTFTRKDKVLWVQIAAQEPAPLVTVGLHKFLFSRPDQNPFTLEFNLLEKKMALKQGDTVYDFVKE